MYLVDIASLPQTEIDRISLIPGIPRNLSVIKAKGQPYPALHDYLGQPSLVVAASWEMERLDFMLQYINQTRGDLPWCLVLFIGTAPPLAFESKAVPDWNIRGGATVLSWPSPSAEGTVLELFAIERLKTTKFYVRIGDICLKRRSSPS